MGSWRVGELESWRGRADGSNSRRGASGEWEPRLKSKVKSTTRSFCLSCRYSRSVLPSTRRLTNRPHTCLLAPDTCHLFELLSSSTFQLFNSSTFFYTVPHPIQVCRKPGFDWDFQDFGTLIRVFTRQKGFHFGISRAGCLGNQQNLFGCFQPLLPAVPGNDSRYHADTGTQAVADQG